MALPSAPILEGVNVLEFALAAAGPLVGALLSDYGATVVHVETRAHVDILRTAPPFKDNQPGINRSAYHANYNRSKYGVTLNLSHPKGLAIARGLVAWCDVLVENMTPGIMGKWGLDYAGVSRINPRVIMLSMSQWGQTGPLSRQKGYGRQAVAASGFGQVTGWPDRGPSQPYGAYTDFTAGPMGVLAVLAALEYRERTGEGQLLDLSQIESSLHFLASPLMDYAASRRETPRNGNRCVSAAPHGAFPCQGEDAWCAIAVTSDEEWRSLCGALGCEGMADDPRFATLPARKRHEDELEDLIASLTRAYPAHELMWVLQAAGVPAGAVQSATDVFADPQLRHRGHFAFLEHPEIGRHAYDRAGFLLSSGEGGPRTPAPCFGEHNAHVFTEMLGLSDEEFASLLAGGVFD